MLERVCTGMFVEERCTSFGIFVQVFLFIHLNIGELLRQARHIYLRFLSTRYMRPLMRVMGKLIQART